MDRPRLVTERLVLRLGEAGDVPALLQFHAENAAFLAPWSPRRPDDFLTEAYWQREVARCHAEFAQDRSARFCFFLRDAPLTPIGHVNLNNIHRGAAQYCDLGILLGERYQGQGLMSEAVRAAIEYAFTSLKLHRVKACYLPANTRSARLLHRLDFVIEGYAPRYLFINGDWQDHILTSRINPDWNP
ncbi:MAG: GNAT family N-acetyltransferase [Thermomicrobiales bacterium]